MKKIYTFSFLLITFSFLFGIVCNAQLVYSEDFEALTVGEGISQQVPANWTTWEDSPGTSQDPVVSEAFAHGGTKSLVVDDTNNDVVMTVGNLTENRYKMDFYLYIPANRCAFFSPMQEFNPAGSVYTNGCQMFFNNGEGTIDASGYEDVAEFTFEHDVWLHVVNYYDFDNDIIEIYIENVLIHIGAWSPGMGTTQNSLQGFDIYGWDGGTPEFYLDDIVFEQVEAVNPAQNLLVTVQNDFDAELTWEAPVSGTPDSYKVYRDDELIATVTGELTYLDEDLYPASYEYFVMAYYGETLGISVPTDTQVAEIIGGDQRQLAVLETFTGTECADAKWIVYSTNLLESGGLDYVLLNYFQDESFTTTSTAGRVEYYVDYFDENEDEALTCPSSIVNGMFGMEGYIGNMAEQKNYYSDNITEILEIPALYTISPTVDIVATAPYEFDISAVVEELTPYYTDEIKLYAVITENNVEYSWQGLPDINNLVRMIQSYTVDFSTNTVQTIDVNMVLDEAYDVYNCNLVLFLQNMNNSDIMEAYSAPLTDFVEIGDSFIKNTKVYPNPVNDVLFVSGEENIDRIDLVSITGQIINSINVKSRQIEMDLSECAKGVYFVKIYSGNKTELHKLIVK